MEKWRVVLVLPRISGILISLFFNFLFHVLSLLKEFVCKHPNVKLKSGWFSYGGKHWPTQHKLCDLFLIGIATFIIFLLLMVTSMTRFPLFCFLKELIMQRNWPKTAVCLTGSDSSQVSYLLSAVGIMKSCTMAS